MVWDTEGVVINYNGYDPAHGWDPGSTITIWVGPQAGEYNANAPEAHLYDVTCLVGDCNNDGVLNNFDTDALVPAISGEAEYAAEYPLLSGSRWYHADLNCDGYVNVFDIDPYVLKLTDPAAWYAQYDCEACPPSPGERAGAAVGERDGAELGPGDVAALLASQVAPEHLVYLRAAADTLAAEHPDPARAAFWADVALLLSAQ